MKLEYLFDINTGLGAAELHKRGYGQIYPDTDEF